MRKKIIINKKKKKPIFSVITVVKNDEENILQTIKSIEKQSYKNFEYILIDGSSTDNTLAKILKNKKIVTKLISEKDKGIYDAMNKGIKLAKGEVIIFVNSGDILTKNALGIINKVFSKNKNLDFVFGTVKRHYTKAVIKKFGFNKNRLYYNFDFATAHSTGFFLKRKIFKKYGVFNTNFKHSADYDLYYRLIIKYNLLGGSTNKRNLIGIVSKGGYSSKVSFIDHLVEETRIRVHNKQNYLLVYLIFFNALFKHILKKLKLI